ncbi:catalytic subunit of tRNA (adenine(58)-N(1))-methyltransferase [Chloropicon primus]|nr:catalytic subunit of tRNA (adenine(58)-N(1))-methyltransferase [Chloropicon primus]
METEQELNQLLEEEEDGLEEEEDGVDEVLVEEEENEDTGRVENDVTSMDEDALEEDEEAPTRKRKAERDPPAADQEKPQGDAEGSDLSNDEEGAEVIEEEEEEEEAQVLADAIPWRSSAGAATSGVESLVRDGDLVVVYERHDRMKALRVTKGGILQNRYGVFDQGAWIDKLHFGSVAYAKQFPKKDGAKKEASKRGGQRKRMNGSRQDGFVYVLRPTSELWSLVLPHRTQILYVADISTVVMHLRLRPGMRVVESGTGSGSLTHALYRAVAPSGSVFTFEYHGVRADKAREEFVDHGIDLKSAAADSGKGGVWVEQRDIEQLGFPTDGELYPEGSVDAVFLDLPGPWKAIPSATKCLKVGGTLCSFSPCIEQVQKTLEAMNEENVFYRMRTMEILLRPYELRTEKFNLMTEPGELVAPRTFSAGKDPSRFVRQPSESRLMAIPSEDMRGHTGYLTFAQKVKFDK